MTDFELMRAELAAILRDGAFVRSPVLARLLRYLVETTIGGQGAALKSYSVAVDGLGRSPDFDAQVDTYARVQVARLRKALEVYYATAGANHPFRLQIASGSYEVRLMRGAAIEEGGGSATAPVVAQTSTARPLSMARLGRTHAVIGLILLIGAFSAWWWYSAQLAAERWHHSDIPTIEVAVSGNLDSHVPPEDFEKIHQEMQVSLSRYEGLRPKYGSRDPADFKLQSDLDVIGGQLREDVFLIERASNRILWASSRRYTGAPSQWMPQIEQFHSQVLFMVAHASGPIHSWRRRWKTEWSSPYGCWLLWTEQSQNGRTFDDDALKKCASDFYRASPDHPIAVALYGWTLVDKSMTGFTEGQRRQALSQAVRLLETNAAIMPGSPMLKLSQMRAYSFSGNYAAMKLAGQSAMDLNPDNLDIKGNFGLNLAQWNDPQGAVLLNEAINNHFNPPAWYHIGLFVDAMMRNDTTACRQALDHISTMNHSLALHGVLAAALEAHSGHADRARSIWAKAKQEQPLLRVNPKKLIGRLPMAPEVRERLLQWLGPVID